METADKNRALCSLLSLCHKRELLEMPLQGDGVSSKRVICEELARQPCSVIAVNQLFLHVTALSINNGCNGGLELYGQLLSPSVRR